MPQSKCIKFTIDNQSVDVESTESVPISISYKLEDKEDFQKKTSGDSFDINVPATLNNDQIGNTFHNPGIEDMTADESYKRPRPCVLEANGYELLVGKAFLKSAKHNSRPLGYSYDCYGDNADWLIDLKESTLYDFLKHITFPFLKALIQSTYNFDGRDEAMPYVFAPVKYGAKMNAGDNDMSPTYMKPSVSCYWIIYQAFKSLGYKIKSEFFDTDYFRKMVMPWTWGSFLFSEGTKQDNLKFLAKSDTDYFYRDNYYDYVNLGVSNDSTGGAYDDNNVYTYFAGDGEMRWTYLPAFDFGLISVTFKMIIIFDATVRAKGQATAELHWFKNGIEDVSKRTPIFNLSHDGLGRADLKNQYEVFQSFDVSAGNYISAKVFVNLHREDFLSSANVTLNVVNFDFEYARIILGGTISFDTYVALKKWKFLDFLGGIIDAFNLSVKTDPVSKYVVFEPTHPYDLNDGAGTRPGYFNGDFIDWSDKQDVSKDSDVLLNSDGERELIFKFREDGSDGMLKVIQDRNQVTLAQAKYVLPDRFKAGKKEVENRFFSPVMHYDVKQWKFITSRPPQMVCLVPENISNTSQSEAQNTFQPKLCYYKGIDFSSGWISDAVPVVGFPYMFAVNYRIGGENDPVLSYSDEQVFNGVGFNLAKGLLRRFYWQRMAITRNGVNYSPSWFKLNNIDVINLFHREHKIIRGQRWELIEIKNYKPLLEESTACELRKWAPISIDELNNTFPSEDSVLTGDSSANSFDTKYNPLKCLSTDIPQT